MIKSTILSDLVRHLEANTQIPTVLFDFYVLNKETIPAILIKDVKDETNTVAFEVIEHNLSINIEIITPSYKKADEKIKDVLNALKTFQSNFSKKELITISQEMELSDFEYQQSTISIKITYNTNPWEA